MAPEPRLTSPAPEEPGAGPFKAKGLAFRGTLKRLSDAHGLEAVLDRCDDPGLRRFFSQPFLAASWYDIYPMVELCRVGAGLESTTFAEFCQRHAAQQAEDDLTGVYRAILRVLSPEVALRAVIKVTKRYFDFGDAEIVDLGSGRAVARRTGIPAYIYDWYSMVGVAYIQAVMSAAGARDVQVTTERRNRSRDRGADVLTQDFIIRWS